VLTLALVGLGAFSTYTGPPGRPGPIFFFYIPVSVAAVVLGRVAGVVMALIAVVAAVIPGFWLDFNRIAVESAPSAARVASVVTWAFFLIATAFIVGWVAERGGSIRLSRGMAGRSIRALEMERLRMGQDIHDGISQYAAAASFEVEVLSRRLEGAEPETKRQLLHLKQSLDSLVEESRGMVGNLRPPSLSPDRFERALAQLARDFSARTGVQCDLEMVGDISVCGDAARITIYRTVQEALANIERHADAKFADVTVQGGRKDCQVVVQDDGAGFDVEMWKTERVGHYGIAGMKERARALGGWVKIVSGSEDGTRVVLNIPSCRGDRHV
jgi:two-component system NarL family sensor kinase